MARTDVEASGWTLVRPLKKGGQAETFLVYRQGDSRQTPHVLKQIDPSKARSEHEARKKRARFVNEVRALKTLNEHGCPRIVEVVDADVRPETNRPWFVMHYHPAGPMLQNRTYIEPLKGNVDRILEIAGALAETLAVVHEVLGAGHRDVKAENVFFDQVGGFPILGDFGLIASDEEGGVTDPGERLGPWRWRPPELRRGGWSHRNPKSDVYMLGGLIYEALTGGETLDETENPNGEFVHESRDHSLSRFTEDHRLPWINQLLRLMLRRNPELRIRSRDVARLCKQIRDWKPRDASPIDQTALEEAERAAAEYRGSQDVIVSQQVHHELEAICDRVSRAFGLSGWAPVDHLTQMVDVNKGDVAPFDRAAHEVPDAMWCAVRVLVAFETSSGQRPMSMSYVMVGRSAVGEEIVALYDPAGKWEILTKGVAGDPQHEDLMASIIAEQLEDQRRRIAAEIRVLRDKRS